MAWEVGRGGLTDDPVRQPLLVISLLRGLECPTAEVRGQQPPDGVGERGCGSGMSASIRCYPKFLTTYRRDPRGWRG